jgi:hypothetical protein
MSRTYEEIYLESCKIIALKQERERERERKREREREREMITCFDEQTIKSTYKKVVLCQAL